MLRRLFLLVVDGVRKLNVILDIKRRNVDVKGGKDQEPLILDPGHCYPLWICLRVLHYQYMH